jgi:type IV fimbrial biogenesis protein FimT
MDRGAGSGFTAIELLVVLAIAGVLTALATPSLLTMVQNNRTSGEVDYLVGDVQLARAQAIQTGQPITLCASTDGATCNVSSGTWTSGWIVFVDISASQQVGSGDRIIRVQPSLTNSDVIVTQPSTSAITFNRSGMATGLAGNVVFSVRTTPVSASATRCMLINLVGHQQVQSNSSNPSTCS